MAPTVTVLTSSLPGAHPDFQQLRWAPALAFRVHGVRPQNSQSTEQQCDTVKAADVLVMKSSPVSRQSQIGCLRPHAARIHARTDLASTEILRWSALSLRGREGLALPAWPGSEAHSGRREGLRIRQGPSVPLPQGSLPSGTETGVTDRLETSE